MPHGSPDRLGGSWPQPLTDNTTLTDPIGHAATSGDASGLSRHDRNWLIRFRDAEGFWSLHREPPRERRSDSGEASLAHWVRRQRTNLDRLSLAQIDLLNTLPAFEWDPRDELRTERRRFTRSSSSDMVARPDDDRPTRWNDPSPAGRQVASG